MTAEKYYSLLLENGVEKLMNTAAKRENLQVKLVLAFGLELKKELESCLVMTNERAKELLDAQNDKWNKLADMFFNLHGISLIKKDYFSSIWETENVMALFLEKRNMKGKGE